MTKHWRQSELKSYHQNQKLKSKIYIIQRPSGQQPATDERAPVPRSTGVQLKRVAKLSTVIRLFTKHADCRMTFKL